MKKRMISLALLLALLLSLLPAGLLPAAQAAPSASSATVTSLFKARSEGVHPRIFANSDDFARVRKLVQTDPYMKMWYARIYTFCLDILEEPVLVYEIPDGKRMLSVCNNATKRITWLAMVYQISGERRFAQRAVEEMLNVCSFKDWNPSHYLDTAQMSFGVGLGYDWLYHYMTASQRTTIMNGIYKHGVSTQQTDRSCMTVIHNWNPWCNGGLSVAAAAIFENHPVECAAILSKAVSNIQKSMLFQPSGAYPEGPDYSTVGLGFTVYLIDTLDTVLGTDFGLSEIQGMKESGQFLIATNGHLNTFNYGDGSASVKDSATLHWYANRYSMPQLSLYQRDRQTSAGRYDEYLALLWYNPELVEGLSSEEQQLDYLMMSDEYESIASFRGFPGDATQVFAAIKSGSNQTNHTDMDIGTFVMEAMGESWFVEMGKDDYNLPNYMSRANASSGRWTYYRKRAEGQNTIVINPNSYGGQDVDATCQITDYQSTYDGGYATVNMKNAYDGNGATSMRRSLALFDNRSRVRLRDEISCSSASTIYWFAHTQANISISSDGKTATLTQNGKTLLAQIASPDEAKFTKMNAKPLSTSPNPSGQNANDGYQKLVIKLTKTSKASITVFFTPILSESDKNKPLNTWGITNTGKMLKQYDPSTTLTANAEGIYEIHDAEQLCLLSQMVADGNTFAGKTVKLMADIDMKSRTFQPIGGNGTGTAFKGTFDGNHHIVKNLLIFKPDGEGVGFFGKATGATIKNFGIDSGTVFGGKASGGLAGYGTSVTIEDCYNRAGVISSGGYSGGIVGQLSGTSTIKKCYNNAYVKSSASIAGGVVGYIASSTTANIESCYHVGDLKDTAGKVGMIGFYNTGSTNPVTKVTVKNCRSTAAIKCAEITDNTALESYSGNGKRNKATMVTAAGGLGSSFMNDCEWINDGYPVLAWQNTTTLPEDLVLTTAAQLRLVAHMVNRGIDSFSGKTIRLGRDIDLESREWTPIGGNGISDSSSSAFKGTFDGQGYSVSNLKISTGYYYVGFFGSVSGGTIRNFGINSGSVKGSNKTGGLAGHASGTISNCYSRATVSGTTNAAGLVGMAGNIVIENCYTKAEVTATGNAGGLVAYFPSNTVNTKITNSYAACTLNGQNIGGLICSINASASGIVITNSYALSGPALVYSTTGYTLKNSSSQSAANLKAKTATLGAAYVLDGYIAKNSGYPVLGVFTYKSENMQSLQPNAEGIYEIHTAQELRSLAYMVNELDQNFSGKTVKLCADIDLESEEWIPIGGNASEDGKSVRQFAGTFEGDGHVIKNLSVSAGNYYVGLFGDLNGATVRNLGIDSGMVMGEGKVAGIAGVIRSNVTISNCYNKASICGKSSVGGMVGMSSGANNVIDSCYNAGSVGGNSSVGGILGYLSGSCTNTTVKNCYNSGVGNCGIIGSANATATGSMDNCYTVDTLGLVGTANALVITNSKKLSAADLRASVQTLGTSFAEDYFTQNRLFPVLAWENGDRSATLPQTDGIYRISTADQLRLLSYMVRKGNSFSGKTVELTSDIDLENKLWLPIGGKDESANYYFRGTFEGNGHRIHNLYSWEKELGYAGLFGYATGARIQNVGIESGIVLGYTRSAAFAACAQKGTVISSCYNKAMVFAESNTGAFVGMVSGQNAVIENCYNRGLIFARSRNTSSAGFVGYLASDAHNTKLVNCYNVGNVYALIGNVNTSVTDALVDNCYSVSTVRLVRVPEALKTTNSAQVSGDTLRGYASVLGQAYLTDTQNINNGYPILVWENEEHCFHEYSIVSDGAETHSTVCTLCGDRLTEAHTWDAGLITKEASCTEAGVKTFTCTACKESRTEALSATGHTKVTVPGTPATCLNSGTSDHVYCSVCQIVFSQSQTIPRLGHDYIYTDLENGSHRGDCSRCDKTVTAAHSFTNGSCVCGAKNALQDTNLKINHTLNLASDISVNFAVAKTLLAGYDLSTVYLECTMDTYEGNTKTGSTTVKLLPVEQGSYYYFTLTGLTAVQMNDRLSSVLYGSKNGQPYYSPTDSYSIADYAYSQLNKDGSAASLKTLCADLLRYGSCAQSFKGYRTNALADASMTVAQKACLSNMSAVTFSNNNVTLNDLSNPSITWAGKSLNLESKVAVKYVFSTANYTGDLKDLSLRVTYTDLSGKTVTATVTELEAYKPEKNQYAFSFDGLLAAELRAVLSAQVYAGNSPVSATMQYSPDTYGNNKTGTLGTLCKALFAYSDSAKIYFVGK